MPPLSRLVATLLCLLLGGCTLVKLNQETGAYYASTVLVGRVDAPPRWQGPVIVAAYARRPGPPAVAHQTWLHRPGGYELIVPDGEYGVFAFGDSDGNGRYDAGEPAGEHRGAVVAAGNGVVSTVDIVVAEAAAPTAFPPGTSFGAGPRHSTQAGAIADLDAPAFAAGQGARGYWAPMEFFRELGGNIYFLEPYDPRRIPVLFIHGAAGSPQDWRPLVERLDRTRYQSWLFYYPSGAAVDSMAYLLYWKLLNLQLEHRFEALVIVAHSMGGLVARTLLLDHGAQLPQARLLVTLSTPWAGEASAGFGVRHSPAVVPSWHDMQPDGRFMQALFARRLPPTVEHHLLFGHKGGLNLLRPNNDGAVTLASQLRGAAQAEARMVLGFDEDHTSILSSPQVHAQLHAILGGVGRGGGDESRGGRLRIDFGFDGDPGAKGLPVLVLTARDPGGRDGRNRVAVVLTADDSGRVVGPVPTGDYEAALVVPAFRTSPARQPVRIAPGSVPALTFSLAPQGTLSGYVATAGPAVDRPAGSFRPPDETVRIRSIALRGAGFERVLSPRTSGPGDVVDAYLAGQDDAHRAHFSFVGLPAGDYELTIVADGFRPHVSRHTVIPGRQAAASPIELVRAP